MPTPPRTDRRPGLRGPVAAWRAGALALAWLAGCGENLPLTVPVRGEVRFDGGPPPAAGVVYFLPVEAGPGAELHPALGHFGVDGVFRAQTFERGDGLAPGKYILHVECWETPPNFEGKPVKSHVPAKYQSGQTSGFALEVRAGETPPPLILDVRRGG